MKTPVERSHGEKSIFARVAVSLFFFSLLFFSRRFESRQCHAERLTGGAPLQGILERIARLVPRFSDEHGSFNGISARGLPRSSLSRPVSLRCGSACSVCLSLLQQLRRVLVYPPRSALCVQHRSRRTCYLAVVIIAKTSNQGRSSNRRLCVFVPAGRNSVSNKASSKERARQR